MLTHITNNACIEKFGHIDVKASFKPPKISMPTIKNGNKHDANQFRIVWFTNIVRTAGVKVNM
jgi:hypothetical protein